MLSLQGIHSGPILSYRDKISAKFSVPSLEVRTNFFRLLAVSQSVGLGLRESLIGIGKSETDSVMKMVIEDMIAQLSSGKNLGDAMESHPYVFEVTEVELVRAAQTMGNMPEVLKEVANQMENYQKIRSKIKWSLMYPATLIVFTIIAVIILLTKVVPTIVSLFPSQESLPEITKMTLWLSDFVQHRWYVIFWSLASIIIAYNVLYSVFLPFKIFIDGLYLKLPAVKDAVKTFYMYRFSKLLGDFLHAWVDPIKSLSQMAKIFQNFLYQKKAEDIKNDLVAGFTFADSIEWSALFDPILVQIIIVGESTGNLWEILQVMAEFYKEQLMQKIATAMWLIEPILMAFIAIIVWGIVASIFLPLADLVNVITG